MFWAKTPFPVTSEASFHSSGSSLPLRFWYMRYTSLQNDHLTVPLNVRTVSPTSFLSYDLCRKKPGGAYSSFNVMVHELASPSFNFDDQIRRSPFPLKAWGPWHNVHIIIYDSCRPVTIVNYSINEIL